MTLQKHIAHGIAERFEAMIADMDLEVVVCNLRRTDPLERSMKSLSAKTDLTYKAQLLARGLVNLLVRRGLGRARLDFHGG